VFTSLVTDERTDGRTEERTDGEHNASTCQSGLAGRNIQRLLCHCLTVTEHEIATVLTETKQKNY